MCFYSWLGCICIYVCYLTRYWQPKLLMEEISLFVSICWPSSRTCTPYFEKRGVTGFCWYQSQVSYMTYIQSDYIYDNHPRNYLSKQSLTLFSNSILVQSIPGNPWTITLMWLFHPYSHRTYFALLDHAWLDYSWFRLRIDILRTWPDYLDEEE